jgi:L-ascorbate metabolism protein UlaG (beta-lactamase superfamily)
MVPEIEESPMRITWLSHSGFLVEVIDAVLVFDMFQDPAKTVEEFFLSRHGSSVPPAPVYFFVSHSHADHCSPEILRYAEESNVAYVLETEAARSLLEGDRQGLRLPERAVVRMKPGDAADFGSMKVHAFGSTDQGVSFLVQLDGHWVFHAGDLNDWYWESESTEKELAEDEAAFDRIVADLAATLSGSNPAVLSVAFLPLDPRLGRHADRGALRFLDAIPAHTIVPMHLPPKTALPGLLALATIGRAEVIELDGSGAFIDIEFP